MSRQRVIGWGAGCGHRCWDRGAGAQPRLDSDLAAVLGAMAVRAGAERTGGAVPVPGGAGVIEAGLIAGLTSAGIPQDQAVAAVLIQRMFTAYLPPVWGFATLTWMRRREYV